MTRFASALIVLACMTAPAAGVAQTEKQYSVVLVHGAFVDGSGWQQTHGILTKAGYEVIVVQNPTVSLKGDVEATANAIALAKYPVILVGHSYGGAVITEAGDDPKVKSLVYLAAYALDIDESVAEVRQKPVAGEVSGPLLPPRNGFLFVDPEKFPMAFAADADPALARFMAAAQVPFGLQAVQGKISKAAWKSKPTFYMVTSEDRMVRPVTQREMAKRASATTIEVASSHAVMLSHPEKVAAFIESAATASK